MVGGHTGYAGFTVGQRKGLGGGFKEPMFVLEILPDAREVVVGTEDELYQDTVVVEELNWLTTPPHIGTDILVQLRYRAVPTLARVKALDDKLILALSEPRAAVTPGQSAVIFEGDRMIGGGRIIKAGHGPS